MLDINLFRLNPDIVRQNLEKRKDEKIAWVDEIIQLDEQDDIISARDKMGWIQTGRIILVWPDRGHELERRLDLVLLQRHSVSLGAKLALVTQDSEVQFNAKLLGIPFFESLHQAQSERWRVRRRRR